MCCSSDSHILECEDEITRSDIFAISFEGDLLLYKNHDSRFQVRRPWHERCCEDSPAVLDFKVIEGLISWDYFRVRGRQRWLRYPLPCLKGLA